ncbi:MAG: glycerol-3-phosphate dehydrogenase [Miltoncostaeaceae bacterium]|nr:glycerol-3-phosphate dehydrogenase [Miltoncostaeaceae bacterium]
MVAVVGAGSWGRAAARLLAQGSEPVRLVARTAAQAGALAAEGDGGVELRHLGDRDAIEGASLVVLAVPSRATAEAAAWVVPRLAAGAGVLSLTKGLDPATGRRLSEAWGDVLPPGTPFAVLSGPNHAEEVAANQPAAAVVAGAPELRERVQELFTGPRFRVYLNDDLAGVELCAAAKNVIAIAAGMSDGLGFGDNAKATLITRGLAEMTRLGLVHGARPATFQGLAGMGDLVATCTSSHSRNRSAGELIARGLPADRVEERLGQVAEGLWTAGNLLRLAEAAGVELPISTEVAAAVAGKPVAECLEALMARAPSTE